jgi:hypothetical protein
VAKTGAGQLQTFTPYVLAVAKKTVDHFVARLNRLYEVKKTAPDTEAVLGDYVLRWLRWVPVRITRTGHPLLAHPLRLTQAYNSVQRLAIGRGTTRYTVSYRAVVVFDCSLFCYDRALAASCITCPLKAGRWTGNDRKELGAFITGPVCPT